jgi:4'-phosphopantetheinyl transferase
MAPSDDYASSVGPVRVEPLYVWCQFTDKISPQELTIAAKTLSLNETRKSNRFVFTKDQRDYIAAHALLRSALAEYELASNHSWLFREDEWGRPFVSSRTIPWDFNISHTTGFVACALSKAGIVGIDVETIDRNINVEQIALGYFSKREIQALKQCSDSERKTLFVEMWTLKEAYLKATGTGLTQSLSLFSFVPSGRSGLQFELPGESNDWHFVLFAPSERHRMAVAVRGRARPEYRTVEWSNGPQPVSIPILRISS